MNFGEKVPKVLEKLDKGGMVCYVTIMKDVKVEVIEAFINGWEVGTVTLNRPHH